MELVAGDAREILIAVATDERNAFGAQGRFDAYLSLSGGMDPTWLDLFADAIRITTDRDAPIDFIDARIELAGGADAGLASELTVERVDPIWVSAVAAVPDITLDRVTGRWIDRLEDEFGELSGEEKPWIRELAGDLVTFCRTADRAADVVFVWSL
jgi:hypothetical protein